MIAVAFFYPPKSFQVVWLRRGNLCLDISEIA